jgi:hypothetical protein
LLHGIDDFFEMFSEDVALARQRAHSTVLLGEVRINTVARQRSDIVHSEESLPTHLK